MPEKGRPNKYESLIDSWKKFSEPCTPYTDTRRAEALLNRIGVLARENKLTEAQIADIIKFSNTKGQFYF